MHQENPKHDELTGSADDWATMGSRPRRTELHIDEVYMSSSKASGGYTFSLPPGTALDGLVIEDRLGRGDFGAVYRAYDSDQGRDVAVKIVDIGPSGHPLASARLQWEMIVQTRIGHLPCVSKVYEIRLADWGGTRLLLLLMEYADDGTLRHWLVEQRGNPLRRCEQGLDYFRQVCHAIAAVHDHGVIHLDLKPENILFSGETVKLSDFCGSAILGAPTSDDQVGLPRDLDELVVGTPPYMGPEHSTARRRSELDVRADIYSLGAILLDILGPAGRPPSETGCAMVPRDRTYRPPELGADFGPNEARVVRRCMEADPARRYQTVRELLDDLDGRNERQQAVAEVTDLWQAACRCVAESDLVGAARLCGRIVRDHPRFAEAGAMLQEIQARHDQAGRLYEIVERGINSWPLADVITVLAEAIAIYPNHPAGLPVQIQLEIRTRQYRDAMATGLGLAGRGQWQTARAWLDRARQLNPGAMAAEAPSHLVATVLDHVGQARALIDAAVATGHWDRAMSLAREADRYAETTAGAISSPSGGPGQ